MKLKHRFGALLLAIGLASLVGGAAATESVSTFERHIQWSSDDTPLESFPHSYSFTLPSLSEFSAALYSFKGRTFGIDNFSLTIFGDSGVVAQPKLASLSAGSGQSLQLIDWSGWLAAGAYTAEVGGVLRSGGGNYSMDLTAAAPVPEPGEWLMLGIGLLAIGAVARRRMHS